MFIIPSTLYTRDIDPMFVERRQALAIIKCPSCGVESILSGGVHAVAADGTVTPSYVCCHAPCTFHEWVRLDGWTP